MSVKLSAALSLLALLAAVVVGQDDGVCFFAALDRTEFGAPGARGLAFLTVDEAQWRLEWNVTQDEPEGFPRLGGRLNPVRAAEVRQGRDDWNNGTLVQSFYTCNPNAAERECLSYNRPNVRHSIVACADGCDAQLNDTELQYAQAVAVHGAAQLEHAQWHSDWYFVLKTNRTPEGTVTGQFIALDPKLCHGAGASVLAVVGSVVAVALLLVL